MILQNHLAQLILGYNYVATFDVSCRKLVFTAFTATKTYIQNNWSCLLLKMYNYKRMQL